MQTTVKAAAAAELARARAALERLRARVSTIQIAADTGIHQSQVSRLLRGHFRRLSPNVRTLLAYAGKAKAAKPAPRAAEAARAAVIRAALRTWDATPAGAQALVRLLRSVQEMKRGAR
jgi:transcriptional regulator with XRE-family HTH domain